MWTRKSGGHWEEYAKMRWQCALTWLQVARTRIGELLFLYENDDAFGSVSDCPVCCVMVVQRPCNLCFEPKTRISGQRPCLVRSLARFLLSLSNVIAASVTSLRLSAER